MLGIYYFFLFLRLQADQHLAYKLHLLALLYKPWFIQTPHFSGSCWSSFPRSATLTEKNRSHMDNGQRASWKNKCLIEIFEESCACTSEARGNVAFSFWKHPQILLQVPFFNLIAMWHAFDTSLLQDRMSSHLYFLGDVSQVRQNLDLYSFAQIGNWKKLPKIPSVKHHLVWVILLKNERSFFSTGGT